MLVLFLIGGGKFICFQVFVLVWEGICIVVFFFIVLMKDQVENLCKWGILVEVIYFGMCKSDIDCILDNCIYGKIKFFYFFFECLIIEFVWVCISCMFVNLLVVDEVYCILQWGYDFWLFYLDIVSIWELLLEKVFVFVFIVIVILEVVCDIQEKLEFLEFNVL